MRIPKSIYVNNHLWTTKFKKNLKHPETGEPLDGLCDPKAREIQLDSSLKKADREQTYLHELGHALSVEYGFRLVIPFEVEELMTEMYAQFLHHNAYIRWRSHVG